jgi:hypothetical protein
MTTAIVDLDGCKNLDAINAHRLKGDRIVVLTNNANGLKPDDV